MALANCACPNTFTLSMTTEYRHIAAYCQSTQLGARSYLDGFLAYRFDEVGENANLSQGPYRHHYYELSLEINEGCSFQIDGYSYPVQAERLSIIAPQRLQSNTVVPEYKHSSQGFTLFVEPNFWGDWAQHQLLANDFSFLRAGSEPVCRLNARQLAEMQQLFSLIHQEQTHGHAARTSLQHLLMVVLEKAKLLFPSTPSHTSHSALVSDFLHLCQSSRPQNLQLQSLAQRLSVTPKHLSAMVKAQTGYTALETIQQTRLLQAKRLLRESKQTAKEIAHACGFDNPEYFHLFFKKMTGQTPRQFRQN